VVTVGGRQADSREIKRSCRMRWLLRQTIPVEIRGFQNPRSMGGECLSSMRFLMSSESCLPVASSVARVNGQTHVVIAWTVCWLYRYLEMSEYSVS